MKRAALASATCCLHGIPRHAIEGSGNSAKLLLEAKPKAAQLLELLLAVEIFSPLD